MTEARIDIKGQKTPLFVRINGPNPSFQLRTDVIRAMARAEIAPLQSDLLEIASVIFFADSAIRRGGATRTDMGLDWRRSFRLTIPVRTPEFWTRPDVLDALVDAVEFLTEDHVEFEFRSRKPELVQQPFFSLDPDSESFKAEEVILFSGGLNSFSGALEALSTTSRNVILLTHRSAQKAIPRQVDLGKKLADQFKNRVLHIHVLARRIQQQARDSSQRSRSFLFAALAKVVADIFGAKQISFYENGIISHNLPISRQVVGTMATRTTHPLSLLKLDRLMGLLNPERPIPIENRYRWLTKRDVVERIAQNGGEKLIAKTVSCTSIREQNTYHTHCGTCSQCLDRRFAILAANLDAFDFAEDYGTDVLFGARETLHSATMAIEWTRHALKLARLDNLAFTNGFSLELSRIARGYPEMSAQDALEKTWAMHVRHGKNVEQVLKNILAKRSDDILHRSLPSTSLVAAFLSSPTDEGATDFSSDRRHVSFKPPPVPSGDHVDLILDPEAPLQVRFEGTPERPIVSVVGLCQLSGAQALVPNALKVDYCKDLMACSASFDHRHVASGELAQRLGIKKNTIRQSIKRCRDTLESSFRELHHMTPDRQLLIQHRASNGYQLDPEIILLDEHDSRRGMDEI